MVLSMQPPHRDSKVTRKSLIDSLKDADNQEGWARFYDTYSHMIYELSRKAGLSESEAEEVVQETVISVHKKMPAFTYDPAKGSFKSWLLQLIKWRIKDQLRKRSPDSVFRVENYRRPSATGTGTTERIADPSPDPLDSVWEEQWRSSALDKALASVKKLVKPKHYQMFELSFVHHWPVSKVAKSLGVTAAQVYLVKHRVGGLLKKEMKRFEKMGFA